MAETGNQRDLTKGEKTKYRLARAMKECMKSTSKQPVILCDFTDRAGWIWYCNCFVARK